MGGAIRVVHRIGGSIDKQTRWTNSLPAYVKNADFVNGTPEYIEEYIKRPSEYRHPTDDFSPDGYGIDFFDFESRTIHTMQGYCDYTDIEYSSIFIYLTGNVAGYTLVDGQLRLKTHSYDDPDFFPTQVMRMWDLGMLSVVTYTGKRNEPWNPEFEKVLTPEELPGVFYAECLASMEKFETEHRGYGNPLFEPLYPNLKEKNIPAITGFKINWKKFGWTIKDYPENDPEGIRSFYMNVQSLLTDEEKKEWEEWVEVVEGNQ